MVPKGTWLWDVSHTPTFAPPPEAAAPTPNMVPTQVRGLRSQVWEKPSPVRASRRTSHRRGHPGTARKVGAAQLPLSRHVVAAPAYLCRELTQIES